MLAPYRKTLAQIKDDDLRTMATLEMNCRMNMTGGTANTHALAALTDTEGRDE